MNLIRIINWPHTPRNNYSPLWLIAIRLAVLPVMYSGAAIVFLSLLIGWGPSEAKRFWREF